MKRIATFLFACMISSIVYSQENYWTPVVSDDFWGLSIAIYIDGVQQTSDQIEVGAFCGEECRGSRRIERRTIIIPNGPTFENYVALINIYGTYSDYITFNLYDHSTNMVMGLNSPEPIAWNKDLTYGTMNPLEIHFTTPQPQTFTLPIPAYGAGNTGGYHLIASPVTEEITPSEGNGFVSGNFDLYYFDQASEMEWINYKNTDGTINQSFGNLTSGKGYLYASESGTTLQFTGTAYSDDGVIPLVFTTDNPDENMHGWNLVGNPFPNEASVERDHYVMNELGTDLITSIEPVAAMNGVFVKAAGAGESVTFTPGSGSSEGGKISINVRKDRAAVIDRAIVRLDGNSTLPKFMLDSNNTKIYIPQSGSQYAVVSSDNVNSLPVNFKARENGNYTLSIDIDEVRMEYLHLFDNKTGADIDLLVQPDYQFTANSHDYEARFTLVFRAMTDIEEQIQQSFCFMNGRNLYFCEDVEGAILCLVDMTGRVVRNETLKGNGVNLSSLNEGVYVVRLNNGDNVKTQKVVVR